MTYRTIQFDDNPREQAILLLAAAEELGRPVEVVQTRTSSFYAPVEVIEKAGLLRPIEGLDRAGKPLDADQNGILDGVQEREPIEPTPAPEPTAEPSTVHTVNEGETPAKKSTAKKTAAKNPKE